MDVSEGNPARNTLGPGIDEADLRAAIEGSGYPLQARVAGQIERALDSIGFQDPLIQEEWAFVDRESNQTRSIDLLVNLTLDDDDALYAERVRVHASIVVECKQSRLPYVFFLRDLASKYRRGTFAEIAGLRAESISIRGEEFTFGTSVEDLLSLWEFPFFNGQDVKHAVSMSRAARKSGKALELTGDEAYRSLTLPLVKAADYLQSICAPSEDRRYYDARVIVCLGVLDAPMVGVIRSGEDDHMAMVPWVRVIRLEPDPDVMWDVSATIRMYDVVHSSHPADYFEQLGQALREAHSRIRQNSVILATGRGLMEPGTGRPPGPKAVYTAYEEDITDPRFRRLS